MSETEDQSPFGRGFIAATIVIVAILACGGIVLTTALTSDQPAVSGEPGETSAQPTTPTTADPNNSAAAQNPQQPETSPATPTTATQPNANTAAGTATRCGPPDGDQTIPAQHPPTSDGWEVSRRVVVPRSATYGPAKTDPDGFRRCFAHSPTGAVYAAYNVLAALADQTKSVPTARKLMRPGRDTDALLEQLKRESADSASAPTQLAGYRVLDADRDRATIMLALPVESEYMSATITLTWYAGDWRLVPPVGDDPVGAPYSQHRDLDGFVAWSGV
ncbi:hypothetical protein [Kribbella sp. CA-293567]|uniref:hypothetical protein n=1 Tax=Kribbella sp. CA-293567 TaxID=3002436 RepID=UPI0022DD0975|nr:hypothetical protein [Kribbella sp. CA-293567]WBQ05345.1 hypothetical protein OX958_00765 [Kribbella sp. CA-293567]